jgi:hypothetical protein
MTPEKLQKIDTEASRLGINPDIIVNLVLAVLALIDWFRNRE